MRLQALIFLLLSGGLEGRHLSKRGESNRKPRDVAYLTGADIPATGFRCGAQEFAGIYADTETGCQVFHFCESNGRNASFFCPQLTLFNQQFFVCDWAYNVQCGRSSEFYALNRDIYITPESVLSFVSAPVRPLAQLTGAPAQPAAAATATAAALLAQDPTADIDIKGSASEVSRSLSNLVSQLDSGSRSSSLVKDTGLGASQPLGYRQGSDPSIISASGPGTVPEGGSRSGSPSTAAALTTATPAPVPAAAASLTYTAAAPVVQTTPAPVYTTPTPGYTVTTPASESATVTAASPAYSAAAAGYSSAAVAYDDAADPEPVYYDSADPEPAGYYTNGLQGYDPSSVAAGSSYDTTGYSQPAAASADSSYSQVALTSQNLFDPYDSADPEPASYYTDAADPEPASYYTDTVDLSYSSSSGTDLSAANSVASPAASGYSVQVYDDAADPEPDQYYTQQIDLVGSSQQRSSDASQGYSLVNTVNTITDFYNGINSNGLVVDSADPEPDPEFIPYN